MKKKEKILVGLDILDLILSISGFITCIMCFVLTRITERYFFYFIACLLGINIIGQIKKLEKKLKRPRIIKYSQHEIETKYLKKVSF